MITNYKDIRFYVNKNFKIKVNGKGMSKFVGMYGLREILGYARCLKVCDAALRSDRDVYTYKCHNGVKIRFYAK